MYSIINYLVYFSTSQKERPFFVPPSVTVVGDNVEMANLKNTREIPQHSKQHVFSGDHSSYRVIRPVGLFHSFRRSQSHNPRTMDVMESPEIMTRSKRNRKSKWQRGYRVIVIESVTRMVDVLWPLLCTGLDKWTEQ